jgi:hypothetical protein
MIILKYNNMMPAGRLVFGTNYMIENKEAQDVPVFN